MLIGVFSDVHDNLGNLRGVLGKFRDARLENLLFLGDFCSPIPARIMGEYAGSVHCVFGNGDGDRFAILKSATSADSSLVLHGESAELDIGDRRIALTHYPLYGQALARTGDYSAVFSGHTHEASEERFDDSLWLNPGDILGLKGPPSYAIYDTDTNSATIHQL